MRRYARQVSSQVCSQSLVAAAVSTSLLNALSRHNQAQRCSIRAPDQGRARVSGLSMSASKAGKDEEDHCPSKVELLQEPMYDEARILGRKRYYLIRDDTDGQRHRRRSANR